MILILGSCKGEVQNKEIKAETSTMNFFDKKYFKGYRLIIDESNISEHPFFSYLNCHNEGFIVVHFIPKDEALKKYWKKEYYKDVDFNTYDFENDNMKISKIIKNKFNDYNIFCTIAKKQYLESNNGCTEESVFLKKDAKIENYFYDNNAKKWIYINAKIININPVYLDNTYFDKLISDINPNNSKKINTIISSKKELIEKLTREGYHLSKEIKCDLNSDNVTDFIYLFSKGNQLTEFSLCLLISKVNGEYKLFENSNTIQSDSHSTYATGLDNIVVKNNYFTLEENTSGGDPVQTTYTTFVYNKNDNEIYLHKYGIVSTYPDSKKDWQKTYSEKDFGIIEFKDISQDILGNFLNTNK